MYFVQYTHLSWNFGFAYSLLTLGDSLRFKVIESIIAHLHFALFSLFENNNKQSTLDQQDVAKPAGKCCHNSFQR